MRKISKIVVHCTATTPSMNVDAETIRQWHTAKPPNGRGWSDIGYHHVILRNGLIEKGRPESVEGAHCSGHNEDSLGVALVGGLNDAYYPTFNFTFLQMHSLKNLLDKLVMTYPSSIVYGHNDLSSYKTCPVFNVKEFYYC